MDDVNMGDIEEVVQAFEESKKHVFAQLEIKMQPWSVLPWKFAGMTHYVYETALRVAKEIKAWWEDLPPSSQTPDKQHPLTILIMTGATLRAQFEEFINGTPLEDLPELHRQLARMRFIPIVERCVEALHGLIHIKGHYRKVTPAFVSLVLRFPMVEKRLALEPGLLIKLLEFFNDTRATQRLPEILG